MQKRKYSGLGVLLLATLLLTIRPSSTRAQDIPGVGDVTGLVGRVVKAIDLKIQRMQNNTIGLQNAQKAIENLMTKLHLQDIASWATKQKELYGGYFQELWKVKTVLKTYWKVKDIISRQVELVAEYKRTWDRFRVDGHFTPRELEEIYAVYTGIVDESMRNLDQLALATSDLVSQISDGKRIALIDAAAKAIEKNLADLRRFNDRTLRVSLSRAADLTDLLLTKRLYGIL